ncbi:MAG: hypothetical protein H3C34_02985 [Caldilineaceae bacterium]|nr:hypothetical protein [Caldilineaceae bacterium]
MKQFFFALRRHWAQQTRTWIAGVLLALAIGVTIVVVQPALAAIQLSYFYVISNPTSVVLQWGTSSEYNVAGYDIQCKLAEEPEAAYHSIGYMPASGGLNVAAQYSFPVTSGVFPGQAYCFRLIERTTDGTPGDTLDRCGYGPNVTPTPGAAGIIPTQDPNALPATEPFQQPTPAFVPTDQFGSPLAVPTDQFGSPLAVPVAPASAQSAPSGQFGDINSQFQDPNAQFVDPYAQANAPLSPLEQPSPTVDPFAQPTPILITPLPAQDAAATPQAAAPAVPDQVSAADTGGQAELVAATPAIQYVVVTATPTQEPVALAPAMTALPTVTPTPPVAQFAGILEPSAQNIMIMLLCLTFTGASGIGILGLITSIMFMRARASQRDFYDRLSDPPRRRYW